MIASLKKNSLQDSRDSVTSTETSQSYNVYLEGKIDDLSICLYDKKESDIIIYFSELGLKQMTDPEDKQRLYYEEKRPFIKKFESSPGPGTFQLKGRTMSTIHQRRSIQFSPNQPPLTVSGSGTPGKDELVYQFE